MADSLSLTLRCWTASPLAPELATFDLPSLIALSACQLYARDRYQVAFDAEDLRLSGGDVRLVGLHEIVRGLDRRGDEPSTSDVAYLDLAMGRLGSLVLHSQVRRFDEFRLDCCLQALQRQLHNFLKLTRSLYGSQLRFPSSTIVPTTLRASAQTRLEREGLWGLGGDADAEEAAERKAREERFRDPAARAIDQVQEAKADREATMKQSFAKTRLARIAKEVLDVFAARLGDQRYFGGRRPTTLDAVVFANLALLLYLPLPQTLLADLLRSEYASLVAHTERMRSALFPADQRDTWPTARADAGGHGGFLAALRAIPASLRPAASQSGLRSRSKRPKSWTSTLFSDRNVWLASAGSATLAFALWTGVIEVPRTGWFSGSLRAADVDDE